MDGFMVDWYELPFVTVKTWNNNSETSVTTVSDRFISPQV